MWAKTKETKRRMWNKFLTNPTKGYLPSLEKRRHNLKRINQISIISNEKTTDSEKRQKNINFNRKDIKKLFQRMIGKHKLFAKRTTVSYDNFSDI